MRVFAPDRFVDTSFEYFLSVILLTFWRISKQISLGRWRSKSPYTHNCKGGLGALSAQGPIAFGDSRNGLWGANNRFRVENIPLWEGEVHRRVRLSRAITASTRQRRAIRWQDTQLARGSKQMQGGAFKSFGRITEQCDQSAEIGKIVTVVNDISAQTNIILSAVEEVRIRIREILDRQAHI